MAEVSEGLVTANIYRCRSERKDSRVMGWCKSMNQVNWNELLPGLSGSVLPREYNEHDKNRCEEAVSQFGWKVVNLVLSPVFDSVIHHRYTTIVPIIGGGIGWDICC